MARANKSNKKKSTVSPAIKITKILTVIVKVAVILVSVPALSYGGWHLYQEMLVTPRLEIKTINVANSERVSIEEVVALSNISIGDNILTADIDAGVVAIETHPWIKEAVIRRHIPNRINIEVTERKAACLINTDELYVVDRSGELFKKYSPDDALDLVLITGLEDKMEEEGYIIDRKILDNIAYFKNREGSFNLEEISEIHYDSIYGISLYTLKRGVRIMIGNGRIDEKIEAYERVVEHMGGKFARVSSIDLNNERKVVVKFRASRAGKGGEGSYVKKG